MFKLMPFLFLVLAVGASASGLRGSAQDCSPCSELAVQCEVSMNIACQGQVAVCAEIHHCTPAAYERMMAAAASLHVTARSLQADGDPSMSAAMQAANSLTGFVKDQVEGLLNDVQKAEDAVNEWSTQYSELAQINLPEYQAAVAGATVDLSDARESGLLVLSSLEQLVSIGLKNLDSAFLGSDTTAIKNAIDNTQMVVGVALTSDGTKINTLVGQLRNAQKSLAQVSAMSATNVELIQDAVNEKGAWFKAKEKALRIEIYGEVCASVCVSTLGLFCPECYGVAVPMLETKLSDMKKQLQASIQDVQKIVGMYKDCAATANTLGATAKKNYDAFAEIGSEVSTEAALMAPKMPTAIEISFWKNDVAPELKTTDALLKKTLAELKSGNRRQLSTSTTATTPNPMQAATTAVENLLTLVNTKVKSFKSAAAGAEAASAAYPAVSSKVKAAAAEVSGVNDQAKDLLESIGAVVKANVAQLTSAFAGKNQAAMQAAIQQCEKSTSGALASAGTKLNGLAAQFDAAQQSFKGVANDASDTVATLEHALTSASGVVQTEVKMLREKYYVDVCVPICTATLGLGCAPCYAGAAAYVETKVASLKDTLSAEKAVYASLESKYTQIAATATGLGSEVKSDYDEMTSVSSQLSVDAALAPAASTISWWKGTVLSVLSDTAKEIDAAVAKM